VRIALLCAVVALAVVPSVGAAQAAPVSPQVLEKRLNEHGGYLHDNLMVGSPCALFKNRTRVLALVKRLLIYNGFRPSMTVTKLWARQIGLDTIQDGVEFAVLVVKSGPRQIAIQRSGYSGYGGLHLDRVNVPFDA
jgi:hypothetical protein